MSNINKAYPKASDILEHHDKAEKSWPTMWDDHKIDLIIMGGDPYKTLSYLNDVVTSRDNKMKIAFFERTPKISSTLLRKEKKKNNFNPRLCLGFLISLTKLLL